MGKKNLIILAILIITIIFTGFLLIYFGYNEAFYSENKSIREVFYVFTQLGNEKIYMIIFVFFYFSLDKEFAKRLLYLFLISAFVNTFLKVFLKDPRPATNLSDGKQVETGYGFPSAHAQLPVTFWGYIFYHYSKHVQKNIINTICVLLIITISLSRLIIGVHDVEDIFGGLVIGLILLLFFILFTPKLKNIHIPLGIKILVGIFVPAGLWISAVFIFPESAYEFGQPSGMLLAALVCFPLESKFVDYQPKLLGFKKKLAAGLLGLLLTFSMYLFLNFLFRNIECFAYVWRFLEYLILGIFILLIIPLVLKKAFINFNF